MHVVLGTTVVWQDFCYGVERGEKANWDIEVFACIAMLVPNGTAMKGDVVENPVGDKLAGLFHLRLVEVLRTHRGFHDHVAVVLDNLHDGVVHEA